MKEAFTEIAFRPDSLETIATANRIMVEYKRQGFILTLRQLYYQFVARGVIENSTRSYKRLGDVVNNGRLAGLIDWSMIEDRTRELETPPSWGEPQDILNVVSERYREDPWAQQGAYVEVWIEKEALVGVIVPICRELRLPYFACRGYTSQSEQYAAGKRFAEACDEGRNPVVLHLGDHDPSGIDMTRDNRDRLRLFSGVDVEVRRLALNFDQIEEHRPPPNPAKETDSRATGYIAAYGESSWELDALEPSAIASLIREAAKEYIDEDRWDASMMSERENRETLKAISDNFDVVSDYLDGLE